MSVWTLGPGAWWVVGGGGEKQQTAGSVGRCMTSKWARNFHWNLERVEVRGPALLRSCPPAVLPPSCRPCPGHLQGHWVGLPCELWLGRGLWARGCGHLHEVTASALRVQTSLVLVTDPLEQIHFLPFPPPSTPSVLWLIPKCMPPLRRNVDPYCKRCSPSQALLMHCNPLAEPVIQYSLHWAYTEPYLASWTASLCGNTQHRTQDTAQYNTTQHPRDPRSTALIHTQPALLPSYQAHSFRRTSLRGQHRRR